MARIADTGRLARAMRPSHSLWINLASRGCLFRDYLGVPDVMDSRPPKTGHDPPPRRRIRILTTR